ncbi:hypothetical protein SAMN05518672_10444 [Chitinophaga sp. CF118]|uniref:hypothetical protein n=1 Tax=Chitinophaga sp. CF118 TaxID=1884367 RepID=UPI0008F3AB8C|nr:hypothetical protein [Chitinophaga sp. CF118]SFD98628.1 hypothetical protein SAMN05518672_10444 [Chitinophaga sp. CF118]
MLVYITEKSSDKIPQKLTDVYEMSLALGTFLKEKHYGADLQVLYIGLFCMNPDYASLFKPSKPKYIFEGKEYIFDGMQAKSEDRTLEYELRLDYDTYSKSNDIRLILARDILKSLDVISTVKKIKDFDLNTFRNDFKLFFESYGWYKTEDFI